LMERRFYEQGKKTGIFDGWWPNGHKRLTYHFQNGEYEGNCRDWTDRGVLINDMNYHEGHETGEQRQFYEDGKIKSNYVIKDGRRYGLLGTKNCVNVSDSVFR
jgi:antitoxin component YwqK of YwqJK toxin-antitoxin module